MEAGQEMGARKYIHSNFAWTSSSQRLLGAWSSADYSRRFWYHRKWFTLRRAFPSNRSDITFSGANFRFVAEFISMFFLNSRYV
jgi:hypothetical protein